MGHSFFPHVCATAHNMEAVQVVYYNLLVI